MQARGNRREHFSAGETLAGFPLAPGGFANAEGFSGHVHFQPRLLPQSFQIGCKNRAKAIAMEGIGFCFSGGHGGIWNPHRKRGANPKLASLLRHWHARTGTQNSEPRQLARLREPHSCTIEKCQFSVETILRVNALNCQMSSWFWAFFLV